MQAEHCIHNKEINLKQTNKQTKLKTPGGGGRWYTLLILAPGRQREVNLYELRAAWATESSSTAWSTESSSTAWSTESSSTAWATESSSTAWAT